MSRSVAYYGCDHSRQTGIKSPCQNRCLVREDEVSSIVIGKIRAQFTDEWIQETIKEIESDLQSRLGSAQESLHPVEVAIKRFDTQIESAERRLVHIPEDSMPVVLGELARLKEDREALRLKARLIQSQVGTTFDATVFETEIRERVARLLTSLESDNVLDGRNELRKEVVQFYIAPDRTAVLHPRPNGILASLCDVGGASLYPRRDSNPRPPV